MQTSIGKWRVRQAKRKAQKNLTDQEIVNMDYELLSDVNKRRQTNLAKKGIGQGAVL